MKRNYLYSIEEYILKEKNSRKEIYKILDEYKAELPIADLIKYWLTSKNQTPTRSILNALLDIKRSPHFRTTQKHLESKIEKLEYYLRVIQKTRHYREIRKVNPFTRNLTHEFLNLTEKIAHNLNNLKRNNTFEVDIQSFKRFLKLITKLRIIGQKFKDNKFGKATKLQFISEHTNQPITSLRTFSEFISDTYKFVVINQMFLPSIDEKSGKKIFNEYSRYYLFHYDSDNTILVARINKNILKKLKFDESYVETLKKFLKPEYFVKIGSNLIKSRYAKE